MAPLSGKSNLLIQWHSHNPYIKQITDSLTLPSFFEGRLKKREDLSKNYDKFWPFYDCLAVHSTSLCKYCIGRPDFDECRRIFTCVENYPIETCDHIAFSTKEETADKISELEKKLNNKQSSDSTVTELAMLKNIYEVFKSLDIMTPAVKLEELQIRLDKLSPPADRKNKILKLKKQILNLQIEILKIKLSNVINQIDTLDNEALLTLKNNLTLLKNTKDNLKKLQLKKKKLLPILEVKRELVHFLSWTKKLKKELQVATPEQLAALEKWSVNPDDSDGIKILNKISELGALLNIKQKTALKNSESGSNSDTATEGDSANQKDSSAAEKNSANDNNPAAEDQNKNKNVVRVAALLTAINERIIKVLKKVNRLKPGEVPRFDKWAGRTDVIGTIPEALRTEDVFAGMKKMEKMLADYQNSPETESVSARYKKIKEDIESSQNRIAKLNKTGGLEKLQLVNDFKKLKQNASKIASEEQFKQTWQMWRSIDLNFQAKEFYPARLNNYPKLQKELSDFIKKSRIPQIESEVKKLEALHPSTMWVLLDKEKPSDNPWVLFIYIVIPIMIIINTRKLLRFIAARKA
jgi:hypothetical protein